MKGVFLYRADSIYDDVPDLFYRFPASYLSRARQFVGDWIVYMEPVKAGKRGYHAVARVQDIVPDPARAGMFLAMIEPNSYLELGRDVPFRRDGALIEQGVLNEAGRISGRAQAAVRALSNEDFNRILRFGLVSEEELLPRVGDVPVASLVQEEAAAWEGPVDRAAMLVSRKVRDRQFRLRVMQAYDGRCALTGMKLVNGGGRLETEAAHIMSVEAGGPDKVTNGIALSGTVHWMFDRGLIGLSDAGEVLLSRKINDREGVEKMLLPGRMARLPEGGARPHRRYLAWHRDHFGFDASAQMR